MGLENGDEAVETRENEDEDDGNYYQVFVDEIRRKA